MPIPIYKKTIFDTMKNRELEIAEKIPQEDKDEICRIMSQLISHKDARGAWTIPNGLGMELLVYFQRHVDPNAKSNIFGCGGCAKKMVGFMERIYKLWQNQIK